jgi:hypothetical protein
VPEASGVVVPIATLPARSLLLLDMVVELSIEVVAY